MIALIVVAPFLIVALVLVALVLRHRADERRLRAREGMTELELLRRPDLLTSAERSQVRRVQAIARARHRAEQKKAEGRHEGIDVADAHELIDDEAS